VTLPADTPTKEKDMTRKAPVSRLWIAAGADPGQDQ
jgi:hypothetical protein